MTAFAKKFYVDMSKFRPNAHFRKEDFGLWAAFRRWFARRQPELLPITVDNLVAAAKTMKFETPAGESSEN